MILILMWKYETVSSRNHFICWQAQVLNCRHSDKISVDAFNLGLIFWDFISVGETPDESAVGVTAVKLWLITVV